MYELADEHREVHGIEPICTALVIAPPAYRRHADRRPGEVTLSARA
jgi:putative transposase